MSTTVVFFTETNSHFGAPIFRKLAAHPEVDLAALVVRPPGRMCDYYLEDGPLDLAQEASEMGLRVLRPDDPNDDETRAALAALRPDYFLVGNYQRLMKRPLLQIPSVDAINFHPSPLPKYAGLAPFYWMAQAHETDGGVSAIRMGEHLDDGPIVAQQLLRLRGTESARQIRDQHFEASWRLFDLVLPTLIDRSYRVTPQDGKERTYFGRPPTPEAGAVTRSRDGSSV